METVELMCIMYSIGIGIVIVGIFTIIKNEIKQKNISKNETISNEPENIIIKNTKREEKTSLRKIINLIKDDENGGREISRIHSKVESNKSENWKSENWKSENWKKDLKETKLALEVLQLRNSKKFKKELNKIING